MSLPLTSPSISGPGERPYHWVISALIFLGTVITYCDRLPRPTLAPVLSAKFTRTHGDHAWIANSFLVVGALSKSAQDAAFDRIGNQLRFAIAVVVWSIARAVTAKGLGAVIFTFSPDWFVDHFSSAPILLAATGSAPLTATPRLLLSGRVRPIEIS